MTWKHSRLLPAMVVSLLIHALPFIAQLSTAKQAPLQAGARLEARLQPLPVPQQPPLMLPEQPRRPAANPPQAKPKLPPIKRDRPGKPAQRLAGSAWEKAMRQLSQQLLYPEEAIARGLEGEAVVRLVLDAEGNVAAARIEQSSGHRLLDDAALRAARSLKSLPADAPREALLPVRFRLQ